MKKRVIIIAAMLVLMGCKDSFLRTSDRQLQRRIIGDWTVQFYKSLGPFYQVSFKPDGQWTMNGTNMSNIALHAGYWTVLPDGVLLMTKTRQTRGSEVGGPDEYFVPKSVTQNEIEFGHIGGDMDRAVFVKVTRTN